MGGGHSAEGHGAGSSAAAASGLSASYRGYTLELDRDRLERRRLEPLALTIRGRDGKAVTQMDRHGGVRLHLIVVRRDLHGFQHLHPALGADGTWRIKLTLPEAGRYRAFADFSVGGEQTVLARDVDVSGPSQRRPL